MEWVKFGDLFIGFIKVIIWPLVIYVLVNKFEAEVKALINHIKISLSFGDKKVEVTHQQDSAQKEQQESTSNEDERKKIEKENEKNKGNEESLLEQLESTKKTNDTLFLLYHFEKSYRVIFGSQLFILSSMQTAGKITDDFAKAVYLRTNWVDSYPYDQYMNFLVNSGFISSKRSDNIYFLLPVGKYFIEYLKNNNITLNKQPY